MAAVKERRGYTYLGRVRYRAKFNFNVKSTLLKVKTPFKSLAPLNPSWTEKSFRLATPADDELCTIKRKDYDCFDPRVNLPVELPKRNGVEVLQSEFVIFVMDYVVRLKLSKIDENFKLLRTTVFCLSLTHSISYLYLSHQIGQVLLFLTNFLNLRDNNNEFSFFDSNTIDLIQL